MQISATYRRPGERVRVGLIVGCVLRREARLVCAYTLHDPVDPHHEALRRRASTLLCEKHAHHRGSVKDCDHTPFVNDQLYNTNDWAACVPSRARISQPGISNSGLSLLMGTAMQELPSPLHTPQTSCTALPHTPTGSGWANLRSKSAVDRVDAGEIAYSVRISKTKGQG